MTKSELIARLMERFQLEQKDTTMAVNEILECVGQALAAGGRVEIRDFGVFASSYHASRVGRNPLSGEKVVVPAKHVLHFKASKALRDHVNELKGQYPLPRAKKK